MNIAILIICSLIVVVMLKFNYNRTRLIKNEIKKTESKIKMLRAERDSLNILDKKREELQNMIQVENFYLLTLKTML